MPHDLKIFVVDTGPLITLAVAQSLDYLLYVDADVIVPDAVLHEATFDAGRLGAQDIIAWVKAHRSRIEIAPTRAYQVFDAARASIPNLRSLGPPPPPPPPPPPGAPPPRPPPRPSKSSRSPNACATTNAACCCAKKPRFSSVSSSATAAVSSKSALWTFCAFWKPNNVSNPLNRCLNLLRRPDGFRHVPRKCPCTTQSHERPYRIL